MSALLVLGGARSGKSRHAQLWAESMPGRLAYVATAQALDTEMTDRIEAHRRDRGERWHTLEAPLNLSDAIAEAALRYDAILVDCLTLWLSNCMLAGRDIGAATGMLEQAIAACGVPIALVANEVGLSVVPDNALARRFRDEAGRLNQRIAAIADNVVFVAAGLPLSLK